MKIKYNTSHQCKNRFCKIENFRVFKYSIVPFILAVIIYSSVLGKEGMWIPLFLKQLNEPEMQSMGLKLSAEDIYSINQSSLKDAVVQFGGGCTAELISSRGLLLTNHHCGFSYIQYHSSVRNDYLTDGFWAKSNSEELPNTDLSVTFIVRIENVTEAVLEGISNTVSEAVRYQMVAENMNKVKKNALADSTHYEAIIKPFYEGNEYYMFITETFKDIRLVGAPPSSIGKFGGDTDNWMWPRHNADFSLFRIYADTNNKPAEYSKDNVPYRAKHYFPISMNGVKPEDFTMVFGFPGRTEEYLTSYAVDQIKNVLNPVRISMRELSLSVMNEDMRNSDEVRIKYAAKQARISNYHKKWIGENRGLEKLDAVNKKRAREQEFMKKIQNDNGHKNKYGNLMGNFEKYYTSFQKYVLYYDCMTELIYSGPEVLKFAKRFQPVVERLLKSASSVSATEEEIKEIEYYAGILFKDYWLPTDKRIFAALVEEFYKRTDYDLQPKIFKKIISKYNGDFKAYADDFYGNSLLVDEDRVKKTLKNLNGKTARKLLNDPAYELVVSISDNFKLKIAPSYYFFNAQTDSLSRVYIKAIMELLPDKKFYPDANSTLRLAYGKVEGYQPGDGVYYNYFTTLDGIIEKFDSTDTEFVIPEKLMELYKSKDYGKYAQKDTMHVCFISSNHTTGGNSGSPVLNGYGHLIGLNFDRNWEGTMSDIMYDPDRVRNISVDIRYILFIIDKFAGAGHLVEEMELIY